MNSYYNYPVEDYEFDYPFFIFLIIYVTLLICYLRHKIKKKYDGYELLPKYKEAESSAININISNVEDNSDVTPKNNNYHLPTYEETTTNSKNN